MIRPKLRNRLLRHAGSVFGAALLPVWTLAVVCGAVACRSSGAPDAVGEPLAVQEEGQETIAATAPSAGEVSEASVTRSTATEGASQTLSILPSTRRTSEGLPSSLAGYQSWYRVDPPAAPHGRGPHLRISRTYVLLPNIHTVGVGDRLEPPFPDETILVLESKSPGADFIEAISMMKRIDGTWEYQEFARPHADSAFRAAEGQTDACAGCHSKASTDSVYAQLELR